MCENHHVILKAKHKELWVELEGYKKERSVEILQRITDNLTAVFDISEKENITTGEAANRLAERRMATIGRLKQTHQGRATRVFSNLKMDDR
jgi:leucine dehydrogenase